MTAAWAWPTWPMPCGPGALIAPKQAYHVLDAMHAVLEASSSGQHIELASTCERSAALPAGSPEHQLEES